MRTCPFRPPPKKTVSRSWKHLMATSGPQEPFCNALIIIRRRRSTASCSRAHGIFFRSLCIHMSIVACLGLTSNSYAFAGSENSSALSFALSCLSATRPFFPPQASRSRRVHGYPVPVSKHTSRNASLYKSFGRLLIPFVSSNAPCRSSSAGFIVHAGRRILSNGSGAGG